MNEKPAMVSGDRYFGGLFRFFFRAVRKHLLVVILFPPAAMALAFFLVKGLPPVYAAQASVRIGRVDGVEAIGLQAAVSRVNSQPFKQRVLQAINASAAENDRIPQSVVDNLTVRAEIPDTLAVSIRGPVASQIRRVVDAMVSLLNEEQEKVQGPLVADINAQLAASDADIAGLLEARTSLSALAKAVSASQSDDAISATMRRVWLMDMVSRNEQRLATATAERRALAARLSVWRTYPTALMDGVFVSPDPVSPRPVMTAILAGVVMLAAALAYALLRDGARRVAVSWKRSQSAGELSNRG
jgi:hypothetical protein